MIKRILLSLFCILCVLASANAQKISNLYAPDDNGYVFTSLEDAVNSKTTVYRLKLNKLPNRDSLPEGIFLLSELRELTVKGCKLYILNQNISKLTKLEYLNLDKNKLLRLPNSICDLNKLSTLIISRNIIEALPDSIGKMTSLKIIDAWDNPLYFLPESIKNLSKSLNIIDLRQIPLTKQEYDTMEKLLPYTKILFTDICECENRRNY